MHYQIAEVPSPGTQIALDTKYESEADATEAMESLKADKENKGKYYVVTTVTEQVPPALEAPQE